MEVQRAEGSQNSRPFSYTNKRRESKLQLPWLEEERKKTDLIMQVTNKNITQFNKTTTTKKAHTNEHNNFSTREKKEKNTHIMKIRGNESLFFKK